MNWDTIKGNWKQMSGKVKQKWGKLTDDDLTAIAGKRDALDSKSGVRKDVWIRGGFLLSLFSEPPTNRRT